MQNKISFVLESLGLIGLIYGYTKKNRNIMLISALVLWFGGSLNDFVKGFIDGMHAH
ncbi:hypothetical protein [Geothrix sp.]|jgi:hypothetical protein|uniref:hypothetical protein n=1 Tax=Geothrix sp. TaxID=1962974 RepID=UPI0025C5A9E5|nr:hypothetical protein [Geothrix sp.]